VRIGYAVAVAAVFVALTPASVWERLGGIQKLTSTSTIAQADPEGSAEQRVQILNVAWRIFKDHPVVGVGLGAYPNVNGMYAPELGRRDTHNTYLNLAAEVGVPGLLLWLALIISILKNANRSRKNAVDAELANKQVWIERTLVGFLVASIFGTYSALTILYLMLGSIWCSTTLLAARADKPVRTGSRVRKA
jgi:O-antigen ligase